MERSFINSNAGIKMFDNELIKVFIPLIRNEFTAQSITNIAIKQAYQPTQQGANLIPTIYFYKIGDKRFGFLERVNKWNKLTSEEDHTERQAYETTFQVNCWSIQDPTNTNQLTASDLLNIAAASLQSDIAINTFQQNDIGVLRITDIRNIYFNDDFDRFESSPSFDFTLQHYQTINSTENILTQESSELNIYQV